MIDALIKRVSVTYKCYEMCAHRGKKHATTGVLRSIIDIVYGVCRTVIKSVQKCIYFLVLVNLLLVGVNYGQRTM